MVFSYDFCKKVSYLIGAWNDWYHIFDGHDHNNAQFLCHITWCIETENQYIIDFIILGLICIVMPGINVFHNNMYQVMKYPL